MAAPLCAAEIEAVPGEYIVQLKPGVSLEALDMLGGEANTRVILQEQSLILVKRSTVERASASLQTLSSMPVVEFAEPNYIWRSTSMPISNDPNSGKLWGLKNEGQLEPKSSNPGHVPKAGLEGVDIEAEAAWKISRGESEVVVGVIDTGIDFNHEDLKENIWVNQKEFAGIKGVDDDGNGFIDDVHGWNFANNIPDGFDDQGHGTHCAGTIGALGDNGKGVIGVAPQVKLMAIKFLDKDGSGTTENAIKAVDYSVKMKVDLTSNSWGGGGFSQALFDVIQRAQKQGQLFVAAAGNDGKNTDTSVNYPSGYNLDNILSVAAVDNRGKLATFSNYGKQSVDIGAPGVNILSSVPGNKYDVYSGTSMATPHVAGAAALVLSHQQMSYLELKKRLMESSRVMSSLQGKTVSGGLLNVHHALLGTKPAMLASDPVSWSQVAVSISTPHPYAANFETVYEVRVPGAKKIAAYFDRFELEGSFGGQIFDFVEVQDGSGNVVSKYFGTRNQEYSDAVEGEVLRIRIKTDDIYHLYGFDVSKVAVQY